MQLRFFAIVLCFICACTTSQSTEEDESGRELSDLQTSIVAGIYSGDVTCHYISRNGAFGIVEEYDYEFNESFTFGERGLPNAGAGYNPDNDVLHLFGEEFEVINRTHNASDNRYEEEAILNGNIEGNEVDGLISWLFTMESANSIEYRLGINWTYRADGVAWTINEQCIGILNR